jgi:hypothetical protein
MKFAILAHSLVGNEIGSIHRYGCRDIKREAFAHGSVVRSFEGDLDGALGDYIDAEMIEMGYERDDVKIHNCAKGEGP